MVSLVNDRQGYINSSFSTALSNRHYSPEGQVSAEVMSRGLAIKPLFEVANLDYPVSGNLSIDVSMHGPQLNPWESLF